MILDKVSHVSDYLGCLLCLYTLWTVIAKRGLYGDWSIWNFKGSLTEPMEFLKVKCYFFLYVPQETVASIPFVWKWKIMQLVQFSTLGGSMLSNMIGMMIFNLKMWWNSSDQSTKFNYFFVGTVYRLVSFLFTGNSPVSKLSQLTWVFKERILLSTRLSDLTPILAKHESNSALKSCHF